MQREQQVQVKAAEGAAKVPEVQEVKVSEEVRILLILSLGALISCCCCFCCCPCCFQVPA